MEKSLDPVQNQSKRPQKEEEHVSKFKRKPGWLKAKFPSGENFKKVRDIVSNNKLHTICQSGGCPNIGDCWNAGTASFMILGDICTRACKFCNVSTGRPNPIDIGEPRRVAEAIRQMGIKHAVITSVDRDELKDCGSIAWANTIRMVKRVNPNLTLETLIPDFKGIDENIQRIIDETPTVVSHNQETVRRLSPRVRPQSKYDRSLYVLQYLKDRGMRTKSGIMLGLGEDIEEILQTMQDLRDTGCDIITIGQYLRPSEKHLPVERFVAPKEFLQLRDEGYRMGFDYVESGPMIRSSYHSEKQAIPGYGIRTWKKSQSAKS